MRRRRINKTIFFHCLETESIWTQTGANPSHSFTGHFRPWWWITTVNCKKGKKSIICEFSSFVTKLNHLMYCCHKHWRLTLTVIYWAFAFKERPTDLWTDKSPDTPLQFSEWAWLIILTVNESGGLVHFSSWHHSFWWRSSLHATRADPSSEGCWKACREMLKLAQKNLTGSWTLQILSDYATGGFITSQRCLLSTSLLQVTKQSPEWACFYLRQSSTDRHSVLCVFKMGHNNNL